MLTCTWAHPLTSPEFLGTAASAWSAGAPRPTHLRADETDLLSVAATPLLLLWIVQCCLGGSSWRRKIWLLQVDDWHPPLCSLENSGGSYLDLWRSRRCFWDHIRNQHGANMRKLLNLFRMVIFIYGYKYNYLNIFSVHAMQNAFPMRNRCNSQPRSVASYSYISVKFQ